MPYQLDDVIQIDFYQEYLAQSVINSLFYKITQIIAGAITDAVIDSICGAIVAWLKDLQSSNLSHIGQTVYNLTDGITTNNFVNTAIGAATTGDDLAAFIAVGMKKSVLTRITRPGAIRIAGIKESSVVGNLLTAGAVTAFETVGNLLGNNVNGSDSGNTVVFTPVVVGRNIDGSFNLAKVNVLADVGLPRLTTQNSRKYWRGD